MDQITKDIIAILQKNARTSNADIALQLGMTEEQVAATVSALEADRTIVKYTAVVNEDKLHHEPAVIAIIEVRISPMRERGFGTIAQRIYKFDEVDSVYLMSGDYDLAVIMHGDSMRQVAFFVFQKLATIDGVLSTATHFVMKKYKESGVIFEIEETEPMLAVSP